LLHLVGWFIWIRYRLCYITIASNVITVQNASLNFCIVYSDSNVGVGKVSLSKKWRIWYTVSPDTKDSVTLSTISCIYKKMVFEHIRNQTNHFCDPGCVRTVGPIHFQPIAHNNLHLLSSDAMQSCRSLRTFQRTLLSP